MRSLFDVNYFLHNVYTACGIPQTRISPSQRGMISGRRRTHTFTSLFSTRALSFKCLILCWTPSSVALHLHKRWDAKKATARTSSSRSNSLTCRSHARANERQTSKRDRDVIDENIYSLCRSCGTPSCRQFSFTLALSHGRNVSRFRSIPMSQRSVYADQSRRRCCGLLVEHVKRRVTYLNSLC
jgi:hypothetical protein